MKMRIMAGLHDPPILSYEECLGFTGVAWGNQTNKPIASMLGELEAVVKRQPIHPAVESIAE